MTRWFFFKPLALSLCLAVLTPPARGADSVAPEAPLADDLAAAADAKSAALAFAKAVMTDTDDVVAAKQKDKEKAKQAAIAESSVGTADQLAQAQALASVFPATKHFRQACDARFGPDNDISKGMAAVPDLLTEIQSADIRIEGDSATVVDKDKPDAKEPMKLKKVDGKWKVDLSSMGADVGEQARKCPAIVRVLKEATADVIASRYKTAVEAAEAMAPKMEKATR